MRSGLRKVTKTVKGKKGTVRRTYWVKARAAKALKIAGALALVGATAYGAYKAGSKILKPKAARNVSGWDRQSEQSKNEARNHWYHGKSKTSEAFDQANQSYARISNHITQSLSNARMKVSDDIRRLGHLSDRAPLQFEAGPRRARPESAEERFNRMKRQNESSWNARHRKK